MAIRVSAEDDLRAERSGALRPRGVARPCTTYAGELARTRVVTPDGQDFIVTTSPSARAGFLTGAYPLSRGYLMMMRQPLVENLSATEDEARERHEQLVSVLAEAGARVVRARAALLARKRAETREAALATAGQSPEAEGVASLN